jgi:hypothetical protein
MHEQSMLTQVPHGHGQQQPNPRKFGYLCSLVQGLNEKCKIRPAHRRLHTNASSERQHGSGPARQVRTEMFRNVMQPNKQQHNLLTRYTDKGYMLTNQPSNGSPAAWGQKSASLASDTDHSNRTTSTPHCANTKGQPSRRIYIVAGTYTH